MSDHIRGGAMKLGSASACVVHIEPGVEELRRWWLLHPVYSTVTYQYNERPGQMTLTVPFVINILFTFVTIGRAHTPLMCVYCRAACGVPAHKLMIRALTGWGSTLQRMRVAHCSVYVMHTAQWCV